jgi:hypothetical protein
MRSSKTEQRKNKLQIGLICHYRRKIKAKKDFLTQRVKRKLWRGNQILARANPWTQPESKSTQRQKQNTTSTNQGGRRSTVAVFPSAGKGKQQKKNLQRKTRTLMREEHQEHSKMGMKLMNEK